MILFKCSLIRPGRARLLQLHSAALTCSCYLAWRSCQRTSALKPKDLETSARLLRPRSGQALTGRSSTRVIMQESDGSSDCDGEISENESFGYRERRAPGRGVGSHFAGLGT